MISYNGILCRTSLQEFDEHLMISISKSFVHWLLRYEPGFFGWLYVILFYILHSIVHWSPVSSQRPVMRSFDVDVFFDLHLNKQLRKPSRRWWFETPPRSLWRYCNDALVEKPTSQPTWGRATWVGLVYDCLISSWPSLIPIRDFGRSTNITQHWPDLGNYQRDDWRVLAETRTYFTTLHHGRRAVSLYITEFNQVIFRRVIFGHSCGLAVMIRWSRK